MARARQFSIYDAVYLFLALRHGLPLAPTDTALRQVAARCGVALFGL